MREEEFEYDEWKCNSTTDAELPLHKKAICLCTLSICFALFS